MDSSLIFFVLLLLALGFAVYLFNRLIRGRNLVEAAWADIDVQLQRRHDLVPRLVKIVQAYASHEKDTLEAVVAQRDQAIQADDIAARSDAETELDSSINRLIVLAEAYPELKAGENFLQLQEDLVDVENKLQYARRFYNGAVRDYNNKVEQFPDHMLASAFKFESAKFFQAEDPARRSVKVDV